MKDFILCQAINVLITAVAHDAPHLLPQVKNLVEEINKNDPPATYTLTSSEQITFITNSHGSQQLVQPKNWVLTDSTSNRTKILSVDESITLDRIIGRKQ